MKLSTYTWSPLYLISAALVLVLVDKDKWRLTIEYCSFKADIIDYLAACLLVSYNQ